MAHGKIRSGDTITSRIIFLTDEEILTLINLSKETRRDDVIDDIGNQCSKAVLNKPFNHFLTQYKNNNVIIVNNNLPRSNDTSLWQMMAF